MLEYLYEKIKHVTIPIGVIMGFIGANIYVCRKEVTYTMGMKIIIVLNGLVLSYLSGLFCQQYGLSNAFVAVIGYGSGMFGYSIIVYAIENQAAWMHYFTIKAASVLDFFIDKFKK
jgi:hypothetical protein